ncbi:hypothetical protein KEM48_008209 [Puccinia striiformis f. sp. tritici PST-130]|nr:hypothetical protein KEM48_008209 [Puccinia striiformis f. sp. tritici PST-130]
MSNTLLALFVRLSLELWEAITNTPARAILKQFVEINRHNTDKHWQQSEPPTYQNDLSQSHDTHSDSNSINTFSSTAATTQTIKSSQASTHPPDSPQNWQGLEIYETAQTLKEKQKPMEEQVYQIWTVLSTSKGSGAACISQMLRHVNSGLILEGVQMA